MTCAQARAWALRRHWRSNLCAITVVLLISATVSFVPPLFAADLAALRIAGLALPSFVGSQGAILIYVALVAAYIARMEWADRRLVRRLAGIDARESAEADAPRERPRR